MRAMADCESVIQCEFVYAWIYKFKHQNPINYKLQTRFNIQIGTGGSKVLTTPVD